jgi:hypothetical protein
LADEPSGILKTEHPAGNNAKTREATDWPSLSFNFFLFSAYTFATPHTNPDSFGFISAQDLQQTSHSGT